MNLETPRLSPDIDGTESDARPVVDLPRSGVPGAAIAAGGAILALSLFLWLNQQRLDRQQGASGGEDRSPGAMIASPPELLLPGAATVSYSQPVEQPRPGQPPLITYSPVRSVVSPSRTPSPPAPTHTYGPVSDFSSPLQPPPTFSRPGADPVGVEPVASPPPPVPASDAPAIVLSNGSTSNWTADTAAGQVSGSARPAAEGAKPAVTGLRPIGDPSTVIASGTMIDAVLETPLDTARGGVARAIVSRDVRSFDGSRVLVPRGSRLVGEIGGDAKAGRRVFLIWKTLLLPDGSSIAIDSPAADASGEAGIAGRSGSVGRAIGGLLRTAIDVGATVIGARRGGFIYAPATASAARLAGGPTAPRVTVAAGAKIAVVVAKTLDFSTSGNTAKP